MAFGVVEIGFRKFLVGALGLCDWKARRFRTCEKPARKKVKRFEGRGPAHGIYIC